MKAKTIFNLITITVLLLAVLGITFDAWAPNLLMGQVYPVAGGTAEYICNMAVHGRAATAILSKGDLRLYASSLQTGWGWVVINTADDVVVTGENIALNGGNIANGATFSEFVNYLKTVGWVQVPWREAGVGTQTGGYVTLACWVSNRLRRLLLRRNL